MDPKLLKEIMDRITTLETNVGILPYHTHTGIDMNKVQFVDIDQKKVYIHHTIQGTAAATGTNYGVLYIAPVPMRLVTFREVHQTAGTDGSAVTLTLEKLTGTQAPDAGVVMLAAALSLKATANTVQSGTLTTTLADRSLAIGDRLCMKDSGTLTSVTNVTILAEFQF